MGNFFNWIASLSKQEAIGYASLLLIIMLLIPLYQKISLLFIKLIRFRRMKINHFSYSFNPYHFIGNDKNGKAMYVKDDAPQFVLEGGKVTLIWIVEGALSIRFQSKKLNIKSNSAEVIVNKNNRKFVLEAKGLFSKSKVEIEIPLEKIKILETTPISETNFESGIKNVQATHFTETGYETLNFTKSLHVNKSFVSLPLHITSSLNFIEPENVIIKKKKINEIIAKNNIVKYYNFSTSRYPNNYYNKQIKTKQL